MNYPEMLLKLCQPDNIGRRTALKAALGGRNVHDLDGMALVVPARTESVVVLMAHFDAVPGSLGYNDNGMALVTILSILDRLSPHVEVVFTNEEECGCWGAQYYLDNTSKRIRHCVNLDVCGFGEMLYIDPMNTLLPDEFSTGCKIGDMPPNDAGVFSERNIPVITFSTGPKNCTFHQGISQICGTIHGGRFDNNLDILNFDLVNLVGGKVLQAVA